MSARTRKILIVEDDPWVARLLDYSARDLGCETIVTHDGLEAAGIFAEELPDAVLIDAVVPHLDGLELCRRIKSSRAGHFTPVVVFSGLLSADQEALTRSKADAFFAKPLSPDVVAGRLQSLSPPLPEAVEGQDASPAREGEISLAAQPLPLLLARLYQQRQSGRLKIRASAGITELILRDGHIVQVRSPGWSENLAEVLVRVQRISAEEGASLTVSGEDPEQWYAIGSAAVTSGLLSVGEPERLWAADQARRLVETFRWTDGFHHFEACPITPASEHLILDTVALIHWGLRRTALPAHALEQAVPSLSGKILRTERSDEILRLLPLSRSEKWLLERADGTTTLQALSSQIDGDPQATDALIRASIVLHALSGVAIDVPRLVPETSPEVQQEVPAPELDQPAYDLRGGPAEMLLTLWRNKATGIFAAEARRGRIILYLRHGQLVASRSNEVERLDSLLAQRGRIHADVLPRIRQLMDAGHNIGEALAEVRAIAAPQLHAFVRGELRAALGELLAAEELSVSFTELPLPDAELAPHEWDTGIAVVELARAQDAAEVRRLVPSLDELAGRSAPAELVEALALSPAERNLWNLLASRQPWRRLTGAGLVSPADQQRALAVLRTLGLVEILSAEQAAEPPDEAQVEPASIAPRRKARDILALPEESEVADGDGDTVPRALYQALLEEKAALEARLGATPQDDQAWVPRESYEELLREKVELKARVTALLAEIRRDRDRDPMRTPKEGPEESGSRPARRTSSLTRLIALASRSED